MTLELASSPQGEPTLLCKIGRLRIQRSHYISFMIALVCILAAFLFDRWLVDHLATLFPDGSNTRRLLKLSRWPLRWPLIVALIGVLAMHPRRKRLIPACLLTLALAFGSLYALKTACGRARPDEHLGAYVFQPFGFQNGFDSFPSGHTTEAFVIAMLMGAYFPRTRLLFLTAAILAALSRVVQERHFVSDVLAGFLIAAISIRIAIAIFGRSAFPAIRGSQFRGRPRSAEPSSILRETVTQRPVV